MAFTFSTEQKIGRGQFTDFDPTDTGPVQMGRGLVDLMSNRGIQPRDEGWKKKIDDNARNFNYLDLPTQYADSFIEIDMRRHIGSAEMNSMNSWIYLVVCPIRLTDEYNFKWSTMDIYQAPFDRMSPLNVARVTGFKREFNTVTLSMYKRAIEIEGTLLEDKRFGARALDMALSSMNSQAELTFMQVIMTAIVDIPYYARLQREQHPVFGINHVREAMFEEDSVFMGAKNPLMLMNHIYKLVTDRNLIDTAIGPKGSGTRMSVNASVEPRGLAKWMPVMDTNTGRLFMAEFESSLKATRSFPMGGGRALDWIDLHNFVGYGDEPVDEDRQPLRGRLTLGEVIMSTPPQLEDIDSDTASTAAKMLDCLAPTQTPSRISLKRYSFRDQLKKNIMFLDTDGIPLTAQDAGLSPYMRNVVATYNASPAITKQFKEAFRTAAHLDNNNPATSYLLNNIGLSGMTGFRHHSPFVSFNDIKGELELPEYVGDLEPKTLPPSYVLRLSECLARVARNRTIAVAGGDVWTNTAYQKAYAQALAKLLPNSALFGKGLLNKDETVIARAFKGLSTTDFDLGANNTRRGPDAVDVVPAFLRAPAAYSLPTASSLAPRQAESKDDYIARLADGNALHARVSETHLDAKNSAWAHLLQHVSDEAIPHFLGLVYAVHANDRRATSADAAALTKLAAVLAPVAGRPHVAAILQSALSAVDAAGSPDEVAAALDARLSRPMISTKTEARLKDLPASATTLANAVESHIKSVFQSSPVGLVTFGVDVIGGRDAEKIELPRAGETFKRFSWRHFQEFIDENKELHDPSVFIAYVAILNCPFNLYTSDALARHGLPLFNQATFRLFIEQSADAVVLLKRGYDTFFLAAGHGIVTTGISAAENSFTLHAQMNLGVIPQQGAKDIILLPYVMPAEHHGGRNGEAITTIDQRSLPDVRDRPSDITVAIAVNETRHEFPLAPFRDALYKAVDTRTVLGAQKTSSTDVLLEFIGRDDIDRNIIENNVLAQYYQYSTPMAMHVHCATTFRPISNDPQSREWRIVPGTGPLNKDPTMSCEQASDAFNGNGPFPASYPDIKVM